MIKCVRCGFDKLMATKTIREEAGTKRWRKCLRCSSKYVTREINGVETIVSEVNYRNGVNPSIIAVPEDFTLEDAMAALKNWEENNYDFC